MAKGDKKVFLTGGSGFIASHILTGLLEVCKTLLVAWTNSTLSESYECVQAGYQATSFLGG
jgi:nucleoside-diphosphate-sugar epimerase